ncbi:MAG: IS110 family transposase [Chloroflexi bacterium]|nr:IS110 family transposase [Chloroflexota bacterium]
MEVTYPRCCGLDIHKRRVVACVLVSRTEGAPQKEIRTFGTMTEELQALGDWLDEHGVSHVAMEATGVYWKPIYNLLEDRFALVLANAQHTKAVPGRKTDVKDCEWIADLLRHGLLRASYVPARAQRELRELTRYRVSLVNERSAEINRLQKTLEGANIKLGDVATDVLGRSARAMLDGLVAGETEARQLAQRARGRLREKLPELERALVGQVGAHQRFLLDQQLAHIDELNARIDIVSTEIRRRLEGDPVAGPVAPEATDPTPESLPVETESLPAIALSGVEAVSRLVAIPGVGPRTAEVIVAELGTDMTRFRTSAHLASWAGLCPGNHESAGKRLSGRTRKGSPWLRAALIEAGHAARRSKGTYLSALSARLAARRGAKKAAVAVGHRILVSAYHLLKNGGCYRERGDGVLDPHQRLRLEHRLVQRLKRLGYTVHLDPVAEQAS